jgi:ATP-binding cassette, subfamily C (CFTR/MRP), member 1
LRTIRAFGLEKPLIEQATTKITASNKPYYLLQTARQWFFLILSLATIPVSVVLICTAVANRSNSNELIAIGLIQVIGLPGLLSWLMTQVTNLEISSVAIERMKYISDLPPEESGVDATKPSAAQLSDWPSMGEVVFRKVTMRYSPEAQPAIDNLTFVASGGMRVGICGRTGSGKSSTFATLFRLVDFESDGSIIVDGRDIRQIPRQTLRQAMTIIPQDPLLLDLTLRENLDPEGVLSDAEIWAGLEQTQCKQFVDTLPSKLDHEITANGGQFSRGQRQLLALCRALLRKRRILCLDEASSSLDMATDEAIQRTLRTAFPGCTILVVAHRISTIIDMDYILCLEGGTIVEEGKPQELLERHCGVFRELAREEKVAKA